MDLLIIIKIIQLVAAVLVTFLVLIQGKDASLSGVFGGSGGFYRTRRGVEKLVFGATIALGILLVVNSTLFILLS